jgi:membrane-associated protease RseP (regulator of RpoE activity)
MFRSRSLVAGLAVFAAGGIAAAAPPGHGGGGHVGGGHVGGVHVGGFHAAPAVHAGHGHVNPGAYHGGYHPAYNGYHYNPALHGYSHGYYRPYGTGVAVGVGLGSAYRYGYGYPFVIGGAGYRTGYGRGPVVISVPGSSGYLTVSPPAAVSPTTSPAPTATGDTALQIADVSPGPAQQAGLRAGDVIFAINGSRVQTGDDMRKIVGPAAEVEVEFFKPQDGRTATVKVTPKDGYIGVTVEQIPVEFRK